MARTIEQTEWVPTQEWLAWSDTFDQRIGFREADRGVEEEAARARAEVEVRHRGELGHDHDLRIGDKPWNVTNDVTTTTPGRAGRKALHRWLGDGEARAEEARSRIIVPTTAVRHPNRVVPATPQDRAEAEAEADEIRRVLHEYGVEGY